MLPHNNQLMCKLDLAFVLYMMHTRLGSKTTEGCRVTSVKIPNRDTTCHGAKSWHCLKLQCLHHSHLPVVIPGYILEVGPATSSVELVSVFCSCR